MFRKNYVKRGRVRTARSAVVCDARRAAPLSGVVARAARIPSLKVETYLETLARGLIFLFLFGIINIIF